MVAIRTNWQNIRQYIWLVGGLLCLLVALIFWAITDTKDLVTVTNPIGETQVQIQPEKVAASAHLGSLMDEVRPLEMTTRVVTAGNHAAEFRGTKFFQENKKTWTVELFKVTDEDIIRSFLQKQLDRKNFIYFRLSGENQTEQYVLVYGVFKNDDQAQAQLKQLNFKFPNTIHPQAIQFEKYASLVNDLGSDEMMGTNKLYEVKLKSAPLPVIDESLLAQAKSALTAIGSAALNTTQTTITRRDESGTVVDVQKSQSTIAQPQNKTKDPTVTSTEKKPVEHEISDPFN
ncbi:SPOR domain-containing protein [Acinetobacter rongchengensis]|uniref:SPOR domain-containing protein n=1 Tax=Acinetobacter rongchengensis TaxID=2419601 RepID=A0A3A8FI75_9GAMM|nr:SPOR domain-containing protein [Acinetobacter rongchengensis]RKG40443.1 SPOR domain-containing protein [Acinetobacter rongchengensis]